MNCESAKSLVGSYLDDELDAAWSAQLQAHLATCDACAGMHRQYQELRAGIREDAPYYTAPPELRSRICETLRHTAAREARPWRRGAIAASILLAGSLAWNFALLRPRSSGSDLVAQNILSSHVRSLIGSHLLDVPSSDQHTVKPWFNGKLDFSPDVKDLRTQGFPLVGGRIDYVGGRSVAVLIYYRRQHVVNLFTWPSAAPAREAELSRNGYHMVHWSNAGTTYWAVSDLGLSELRQFENLYKE